MSPDESFELIRFCFFITDPKISICTIFWLNELKLLRKKKRKKLLYDFFTAKNPIKFNKFMKTRLALGEKFGWLTLSFGSIAITYMGHFDKQEYCSSSDQHVCDLPFFFTFYVRRFFLSFINSSRWDIESKNRFININATSV